MKSKKIETSRFRQMPQEKKHEDHEWNTCNPYESKNIGYIGFERHIQSISDRNSQHINLD